MGDLAVDNRTATGAPRRKIRIGDLLVSKGVISEAHLAAALTEQKKTGQKLGVTLVEMGFIDESRLLEFLSQQLQIPFVDVSNLKLDPHLTNQLPETVARRYRMVEINSQRQSHVAIEWSSWRVANTTP
jgi:MSHA biogenesis protein MshE